MTFDTLDHIKKNSVTNVPEKLYKVGFYLKAGSVNFEYLREKGFRVEDNPCADGRTYFYKVYQDNLKPMTHKEAITFKSKMMEPNNHFLYEVKS